MSFRFNFPSPSDTESDRNYSTNLFKDKNSLPSDEYASSVPCNFISVINSEVPEETAEVKIGTFEIKYCLVKSLQNKITNQNLLLLDNLKTDLVPGKYEGGFKVWECSLDLSHYLADNSCIKEGISVLELGCGAGLPGIVAILNGASVTFQDFNSEVLELVTIPNVMLNVPKEELALVFEKSKFLYGDWGCIKEKYYVDTKAKTQYDILLTSETIYDRSSHRKLLNLMKSALKPQGTIYLAAKIHYFGVGGGIKDFELLVEQDKSFEISTVFRIKEGVERQILKMEFRKDHADITQCK